MHSARHQPQDDRRPKSLARACLFCRSRKIRCDTARPTCAACAAQRRECVYRIAAPNKRPTLAQIHDLKKERSALETLILQLKSAPAEERDNILQTTQIVDGSVALSEEYYQRRGDTPSRETIHDNTTNQENNPGGNNNIINRDSNTENSTESPSHSSNHHQHRYSAQNFDSSSDDELDVGSFISLDDAGKLSSFGPSSALHRPSTESSNANNSVGCVKSDQASYTLIAKAALQRQNERRLAVLPDVYGVPTELAMHLLDLHWSRQHHTFLLTYRPTIMRDLFSGGPHCSEFLLFTIIACSSKYSGRLEVRDDPRDPTTAGQRYFRHCDDLISKNSLLINPALPTVVGLLLLGSTYNARGETSKGWLYTGYALRMITDLGLHLDPKGTTQSAEEEEVRRRVFWGAFICDKLQSLYLGRPVSINLRDCHVSRDFMDTFEEQELYLPYIDPQYPSLGSGNITVPQPLYSVSTFQQLCLLSRIMAKIINTFYVVSATSRNAQAKLQVIDNALQKWRENLPPELRYDPKLHEANPAPYPPPNQMNLHGMYHTLVILLHRPFMSDEHSRSIANLSFSWSRCTNAARSITSIALAWKAAYGLTGAPYLLSYVIYVACTIHVRNAAVEVASGGENRDHSSMLALSLTCLDELCLANPGVGKPISIIKASMEARHVTLTAEDATQVGDHTPPTIDFEAMFGMSFANNTNYQSFGTNFPNTFMFNPDMPHEPLFGLMDATNMPFDLLDPSFAENAVL